MRISASKDRSLLDSEHPKQRPTMIESLQSDVLNRILQKTNGIPLPGKTSSPNQIRPILKNSQSIAVAGN
jgi:hypothetical protein